MPSVCRDPSFMFLGPLIIEGEGVFRDLFLFSAVTLAQENKQAKIMRVKYRRCLRT